jgi:hypothetical protein
MNFHETFNLFQWNKPEPAIESVRIQSSQHEPPQALETRMRENSSDKSFAQSLAPLLFENEHVGQPRERCEVGHDARKADLPLRFLNSKAKRVFNRAFHDFARHVLRPIAAFVEKTMNQGAVQQR